MIQLITTECNSTHLKMWIISITPFYDNYDSILFQAGNPLFPVVQVIMKGRNCLQTLIKYSLLGTNVFPTSLWIPSLLNIWCSSFGWLLMKRQLQTGHLKTKTNPEKHACWWAGASNQRPSENLLGSLICPSHNIWI